MSVIEKSNMKKIFCLCLVAFFCLQCFSQTEDSTNIIPYKEARHYIEMMTASHVLSNTCNVLGTIGVITFGIGIMTSNDTKLPKVPSYIFASCFIGASICLLISSIFMDKAKMEANRLKIKNGKLIFEIDSL